MNQPLPPLIVVLGPTASGKSGLGIALAQQFHGEIVSADSRQVYRGMDIGTAKVTWEERALVQHHLLDVVDLQDSHEEIDTRSASSPTKDPYALRTGVINHAPTPVRGATGSYTVAQFQQQAIAAIDDILARGYQPFLVGGSPHYIQAVVDHLDIPAIPPDYALRAQLEMRPLAELIAQLEELDPQSAVMIDRSNPRRVIRALEVCLISGKPFSQQRGVANPLYRCLLLGISWPRDVLYRRIDARVDERMRQGMIQEVRNLLVQGVSHERLEALGLEYRFISRWLRGEFKSEAEMVEHLKYAIHDFTRRQLTWFRKDKRIVWLEGDDLMRAKEEVSRFLGES